MNNIFSTNQAYAVRIEGDLNPYIESLNDVYTSNKAFMELTNPPSQDYRDVIQSELQEARDDGRLTLAVIHKENEQVIGILEFWAETPNDKKPWIGLFMVHSGYHRSGIGKEVITQFMKYAKDLGYHELRIGVDLENESGYKFWESLGFVEYAKKEISHPIGSRLASCMEVQLTQQ